MTNKLIYHVCKKEEWLNAQEHGIYRGSSQDADDGFIHFSTAEQVVTSTAKHRAGQDNLVLIAANTTKLGDTLKWEPARMGDLFPHLYGPLELDAVAATYPLRIGTDGQHIFPDAY